MGKTCWVPVPKDTQGKLYELKCCLSEIMCSLWFWFVRAKKTWAILVDNFSPRLAAIQHCPQFSLAVLLQQNNGSQGYRTWRKGESAVMEQEAIILGFPNDTNFIGKWILGKGICDLRGKKIRKFSFTHKIRWLRAVKILKTFALRQTFARHLNIYIMVPWRWSVQETDSTWPNEVSGTWSMRIGSSKIWKRCSENCVV